MAINSRAAIKWCLKRLGIFGPVRDFYHNLRLYRRKETLSALGISQRFWTNSPYLYHAITRCGGEKHQLEEFMRRIRPGDVVWDVGSFFGLYALLASRCTGADGLVYAFEPEYEAFELLKKNCLLNDAPNVVALNCALSNINGEGGIYRSVGSAPIHSIKYNVRLSAKADAVKLYRGDDLVEWGQVSSPNVMKIDVEGAEHLVLGGMRKILSDEHCRFLLIEVHPRELRSFGASSSDVKTTVERCGFAGIEEIERGAEVHFLCQR